MVLMAVLFISQSILLYDKYFRLNFTTIPTIGQEKRAKKLKTLEIVCDTIDSYAKNITI